MLDSYCRNPYQRFLALPASKVLSTIGLHPSAYSALGCAAGLGCVPLLATGHPLFALALLLISGLLDTLDGTLARLTGTTSDKGSVLDILCDRTVEFAVVLGLFLVDPAARGLPCLLMLGSILLCITSFLVVGIFAQNSSQKSFHYSAGLMERAEAFAFFALMMLLPGLFVPLAYAFSALVFLTALIRAAQFWAR